MKKHILFTMQSLGMGGVSSVILNYYNEMADDIIADFAVTAKAESVPCDVLRLISEHGGRVYYLPHFAGINMLRYFIMLSSIIKKGNYDVIHDNDKYFGFLSLIPAKWYHVPTRIAHVHNCVAAKEKPFFHRLFIRITACLTRHFSTDRLACSVEAGQSMFPNDDFKVLNNSIDPEKYKFSNDLRICFRNEYGIDCSEKVIMTVARNDSLKRYDFAFKVFDELVKLRDNYRYVIVGMNESDLSERDNLSYLGISEKSRSKVMFLGRCFNANQLLSMADAFLLTSEHEGFGISIIEAQANDLLCFISDAIPTSTKVSELVHFLPCLHSQDTWASVMDKELTDYNRTEVGFEAIRESTFSIERCKQQLLDLYNK